MKRDGKKSEEPERVCAACHVSIMSGWFLISIRDRLKWKKKPKKEPGDDLRRHLEGSGYGRK
jgi:hypothetical protein